MAKGKKADFSEIDQAIRASLTSATGKIAIVSPTIISPSTKRAIAAFAGRYRNVEHIMYDVNSASGLLQANGGILPAYDFSKANVIVSLGADFLGTWISPVEYSRQYITNRKVNTEKRTMSRHFQFEPNLSLAGSNADVRVPVKPSQMSAVVLALYNAIVGGGATPTLAPAIKSKLDTAVKELQANRGASLVVAGSNDPAVQTLVAAINQSLGNVGTTIDLTNPSYVRQGDDARMTQFVSDLNSGAISAVFFYNANPVYNHPKGEQIKAGIAKAALSVSLNDRLDETGSLCQYQTPDSHWLESWHD